MFHSLPEELQNAIIISAMKDAPVKQESNNISLAEQRVAKAKR